MKRGDILAILPGRRIVVLDCVCYSESERKEEAEKRLEKRLEKREKFWIALSHIRPLLHMPEAHHGRLGLQLPRPRLISVALLRSLVTARVMNSCRWPASLSEGWVKMHPVSSTI